MAVSLSPSPTKIITLESRALDSRRHRSSPLRPSIRERRIDLHWSVHHIGHSAGSSSAANRPSSSATSPSRRSLTHSTTPRMHAHQGDSPIARAPTPACVSGMPTGSHNQSRRPRLPRAHAHTHERERESSHTSEGARSDPQTAPRQQRQVRPPMCRAQALIICGMLLLRARRVFWLSVRSLKLPILRSLKKAFQRSSSLPPSWSFWKREIESR